MSEPIRVTWSVSDKSKFGPNLTCSTSFGLRLYLDPDAWGRLGLATECCLGGYVLEAQETEARYVCELCSEPIADLAFATIFAQEALSSYTYEHLPLWCDLYLEPLASTLAASALTDLLEPVWAELEANRALRYDQNFLSALVARLPQEAQ